MKFSHTLSGRLTVYTVVTFAVLLIVCFNLLFWSMNSFLMQRIDNDLVEDVYELSHILNSGGLDDVIAEIGKETAGDESESVFLMVLDDQMNVLHSSDLGSWQQFELVPLKKL